MLTLWVVAAVAKEYVPARDHISRWHAGDRVRVSVSAQRALAEWCCQVGIIQPPERRECTHQVTPTLMHQVLHHSSAHVVSDW